MSDISKAIEIVKSTLKSEPVTELHPDGYDVVTHNHKLLVSALRTLKSIKIKETGNNSGTTTTTVPLT